MPDFPLAYHITFGTYGARVHGDPRGTVDCIHNRPGDPIIAANPEWRAQEQTRQAHPVVLLTQAQREFVEGRVPSICAVGGWQYLIGACQPDHVHVVLSAIADGKAIRRLLKRWLTQELSNRWPRVRPRWAKGGSVKWIWEQRYLETAYEYVRRQRCTP